MIAIFRRISPSKKEKQIRFKLWNKLLSKDMDKITSFIVLFALGVISQRSTVDALKCYRCSGINDNKDCNDEGVMTCDNDESCYTVIEKLDSVGKIYHKGCYNTRRCERIEDLNDDDICDSYPSECWYCCNEYDKCNAFNEASKISILPGHVFFWALSASFLSLLKMSL